MVQHQKWRLTVYYMDRTADRNSTDREMGGTGNGKDEVTREDFSYCKSQWKIIHSFWIQTEYTFHPAFHCVQIKLFTNREAGRILRGREEEVGMGILTGGQPGSVFF